MGAYRRPVSLPDAVAALAAEPHRIVAGGTDVYPADATAVAWGEPGLDHGRQAPLLDVTAIPELHQLQVTATGVVVGAGITWSEIVAAALPPHFDALKRAAAEVGGRQIQNRGTIGGNLCNASPAADGVPPLLALDAEVELARRDGSRRLPLAAFLLGNRQTARAANELMTAVHVPAVATDARSNFHKLGARRYLVISIAMVAVVLALDEAGAVADVRIAVGACSPVAQRLDVLERALLGVPLGAAADVVSEAHFEALQPIDDVRASATYRLHAARVLVARALADLAGAPRLAA